MVSLFSSLNIASNALSVNESAISVVSHNVANMNTEGYSKQKVNLATRNIAGTIGDNVEAQIRSNGGVMIANVMRYNNDYLNNYYRSQVSILNQYEQQVGNLGDLANIFDDLEGEGIDGALSSFYEAVNNLQQYPASSTARVNFLESAKTLASVLNSKSVQLDQLNSKALGDGVSEEALKNSKIYTQVSSLNNKLEELAQVNKSLQTTQTGSLTANNLLDKRDKILNEISEYVDISVDEAKNGSCTVRTGDTVLVKGAVVAGELSLQTAKQYCIDNGIAYPEEWVDDKGNPRENAVINIVSEGSVIISDLNSEITGGALGGLLHSGDLGAEGINPGKAQAALNSIAAEIADMFNTLNKRTNAYHINPNNTSKLATGADENKMDIFVMNNGTDTKVTAANIEVNPKMLEDNGMWYISCAYFADGENFDENAVGNAQNAIAMLQTRSEARPNLEGMSIEDYYSALVGKIASAGNNAQNMVDTQSDIVDSIYNEIKSNNSVDLNEELVDLVRYQTAYAASAQVFNVVNSCLDTLMSLGR